MINRARAFKSMVVLTVLLMTLGVVGASAFAEPKERALTKQWVRQLVGAGVGPGNYSVVSWIPGKDRAVRLDVPRGTQSRSPVMVAVRARNATDFNQARPISPRNAEVASMAVSETGKTMVVWSNSDGKIGARYRTPDRGWSRTMVVAGIGSTSFPEIPDLDIAEDGTAVVGWRSARRRSAGAPMVAMFRPGRGFLKPKQIGPRINLNAPLPYAQGLFNAVSARVGGMGTVVWTSSCDGSPETLRPGWSVNLDMRRDPGRPMKIPSATCPHADVSLSENANGKAVLAINGQGFSSTIRIAVRPAGKRRFRKAVRVSPKVLRTSFADVSVHTDGSATLVAPMFDRQGPAGILGMKFFQPRELSIEQNLITGRWTGSPAVGANNRGYVAVLSRNSSTRRWVFTSKSPISRFEPAVDLPFNNFLNKPGMTIDPAEAAVGPTGKVLAATARTHWNERGGTEGTKGIYVFEGFPRSSE